MPLSAHEKFLASRKEYVKWLFDQGKFSLAEISKLVSADELIVKCIISCDLG